MAQHEIALTAVVAAQLLPDGKITIGDAVRKCVDLSSVEVMNTTRIALGM